MQILLSIDFKLCICNKYIIMGRGKIYFKDCNKVSNLGSLID